MTDVNIIPTEGEEPEAPAEGAAIDLPLDGDAAFASIMGLVGAGADSEEVPPGTEEVPPAAAGDGEQPAPAEGAGTDGAAAPAPAGGDPAESPVARDAAEFSSNWSAALDGLESKLTAQLTQTAVDEVRTEFKGYIDAVEQAPRYLVGKTVPKADGSEGEETLRDAQDARDWQEEIKKQLGREVSRRIEAARTDNAGMMEVLNNSVQLFQSNPDIVPNTKQFDKDLANEFAALIKPFEVRNDGKLVGWKVDVKPMLTTLRQQLNARRAATPAAPAAPTAQQQRAATQPRNERQQFAPNQDTPQAGITSSAGQSPEDGEGLDALFGTLGIQPGTFRF